MRDALNKALAAVGDCHAEHASQTALADLRRFFHGQRVIELGGDGTEFRFMGLDWSRQHGWQAKLARSPADIAPFPLKPISQIKPVDEITIH